MGGMAVWILGATLIEVITGYLFFLFAALYMLEARKNWGRKVRSNKLGIIYLILVSLAWGTFATVSSVTLIQFVVGYVLILFMPDFIEILRMTREDFDKVPNRFRKEKKKDIVEVPLSDIEINDIKLSEKEYASRETPIFDSVEEMLAYIGEENEIIEG
jgi:uncharacterized membrane protein